MFINVRPSDKFTPSRPGLPVTWWQGEVSDLNGRFHTLDGIWGPNIAHAHKKFEELSASWDTFDAPSDEEMERSKQALLDDIAIWGCE